MCLSAFTEDRNQYQCSCLPRCCCFLMGVALKVLKYETITVILFKVTKHGHVLVLFIFT